MRFRGVAWFFGMIKESWPTTAKGSVLLALQIGKDVVDLFIVRKTLVELIDNALRLIAVVGFEVEFA